MASLTDLLRSLDNAPPPVRSHALASFWNSQPERARTQLQNEIEAKLTSSAIDHNDYSLFIRVSKSILWSLQALNTRFHQKILNAAVDVIEIAWKNDPSAVLEVLGGADSFHPFLIHLIDSSISRMTVARLFRRLGSIRDSKQAHTSLVDYILRNIFPFLSEHSAPTPLARYALLAVDRLIAGASTPVILSILHHCSVWIDKTAWIKLADRHLQLVSALFLAQVNTKASINTTSDGNLLLAKPCQLHSSFGAILRRHHDATFFHEFFEHYASYSTSIGSHVDILNATPRTRLQTLAAHLKFILLKRTARHDIARKAFDFCKVLCQMTKDGACTEWHWNDIMPILKIASRELMRSPESWALVNPQEILAFVDVPNAVGLLLAIFEQLSYLQHVYSDQEKVLSICLVSLPVPARFTFLQLFHVAKTGESLIEDSTSSANHFKFSLAILAALDPAHARRIVAIGTKVHGSIDSFVSSDNSLLFTIPRRSYDEWLWRTLYSVKDSISPSLVVLQLLWEGVSVRALSGSSQTEVETAEQQVCVIYVENYKQHAIRSRDKGGDYVTAALAVCMLSRSPRLFSSTLSWVVKRFAKDPETSRTFFLWIVAGGLSFLAGPPGLYASDRTRGLINREVIQDWCHEANNAVTHLLQVLRIWAMEPTYIAKGASKQFELLYRQIRVILLQILRKRCALIDKLYPTVLDDGKWLRETFLMPMLDHWSEWHTLGVDNPALIPGDSPTGKRWNEFGGLKIHPRILCLILPFLKKLAEITHLAHTTSPSLLQHLPFDFFLATYPYERRFTRIPTREADSDHWIVLSRHSQTWLASALSRQQTGDDDVSMDSHDSKAFEDIPEDLKIYLDSQSKVEIHHKITFLLAFYDREYPFEHASAARALLTQLSVHRNNAFNHETIWLPPYPPSDDPLEVDFDPLDHISSVAGVLRKESPARAHKLKQLGWSEEDEVAQLMLPFFSSQGSIILSGASKHTLRGLGLFSIAFILTLLDVRKDAVSESQDTNLVNYAIRKVRLAQTFMTKFSASSVGGSNLISKGTFICRLLEAVFPVICSGADALLRAVFSVPRSQLSQSLLMTVFRIVRRSSAPGAITTHALSLLEVPAASSWHRQIVTIGMLNWCRPDEVKDILLRLLKFCQGHSREASSVGATTFKMVLQLVGAALRSGSVDINFLQEAADSGAFEVPVTMMSYIVDAVVWAIQNKSLTGYATGDDYESSKIWSLLTPYVKVAQRLNEDNEISEEQWNAARDGRGPMPEIVEERPVAIALLGVDGTLMSLALQKSWAKVIVEPVLVGHFRGMRRWLQTAVAREGGSVELQAAIAGMASYGSGMPFVQTFTAFVPHLVSQRDGESVLSALRQRALAFTLQNSCQKLGELLAANYAEGWEHQTYGRKVIELTTFERDWECAVTDALIREADASSLHQHLRAILQDTGLAMLQPMPMRSGFSKGSSVPIEFFIHFVKNHLQMLNSVDRQLLMSQFLASSEKLEREQSDAQLNGGACYWQAIITLKLLILPNSLNVSSPLEAYATCLRDIAALIVDRRWYHIQFPHAFRDLINHSLGDVLRADDIPLICQKLTSAPLCPSEAGMLRVTCFEVAVMLLQEKYLLIDVSVKGRRRLDSLLQTWMDMEDGWVRLLATTWRFPSEKPNYSNLPMYYHSDIPMIPM